MAGRPPIHKTAMTTRERVRRHRAQKKQAALAACPPIPIDPVKALADWARDTLIVPPGHPASGQPMTLPPFAEDFLRRGWNAHESALCVGRKNGKSAICAVLILGFLAGPLRRAGWRGAVCSITKDKAAELRRQIVEIAEASGLEGITVRKSPYPGAIIGAGGQTFETLSADRHSGQASGFDIVLFDETGLTEERDRELVAGLRSSISARAGRIIHLSIRGDSPLYREILDNPATVSAIYTAPDDCDLGDRAAWKAANPGLGTIKQTSYMADEVKRIAGAPGDENTFRAFDLNQPQNPAAEMIITPGDLRRCIVTELPLRSGLCALAFDFGEATSGTAACAIWPATGRVETWFSFGDNPDLRKRGQRDDADYLSMERRGELRTYPGRIVRPDDFLTDVAADLAGCRVGAIAADGYKDSEVRDFLDRASLPWKIDFRRVGAGKDGGRDVRAFQRLIHQRRLKLIENLSLATAIRKSTLRRDANGNPGIDKSKSSGRIDVLSAAVIAAGLAEPHFDRKPTRPRLFAVAG